MWGRKFLGIQTGISGKTRFIRTVYGAILGLMWSKYLPVQIRDRAGKLPLVGLAAAPFRHKIGVKRPLPLRIHIAQVDEEIIGQLIGALGENTVLATALVAAAEGRCRCPGHRNQLGGAQAEGKDFRLQRSHVLRMDQGVVNGQHRVLSEPLFLGHQRAEVARDRAHVAVLGLIVRVGHGAVTGGAHGLPLMRTSRALRQLPFVAEQVLEVAVVPLDRDLGPGALDASLMKACTPWPVSPDCALDPP